MADFSAVPPPGGLGGSVDFRAILAAAKQVNEELLAEEEACRRDGSGESVVLKSEVMLHVHADRTMGLGGPVRGPAIVSA